MIIGAILSVASAFSFSLNNVMARRAMASAAASQGAFITVLIGVPLFLLAALVSGQLFRLGEIPVNGYVLLAAAGILHFSIGRFFNYRAIAAVGSARSQPIQTMSIPYSILIAFIFLGETINWIMAFGILLVMIGPTVVIERNQRKPAPEPPRGASPEAEADEKATAKAKPPGTPAFELRQLEGYSFAILATTCYGTSPLLIRAALEGQTDLSVVGGAIAYFAAGLFVLSSLLLPRNRTLIRAVNLHNFRLFFGAGFFVFLAQMLRFMALSLAPVAIVTPLQRLAGLFTLVLASTINKDLEKINRRVIFGVIISLTGSAILIMGRDIF
ncbi:MAG: DMT family transporter [Dehalococcoidia bacterium]